MRLLLAALLLGLPLPAAAAALTDLLMAPGVFAGAPAGATISYAEERTVPEGADVTLPDVTGATLRLEVTGTGEGRVLRLVRETDGKAAPVGSFPGGVANPLLLQFLETNVRAMAEATGGSPYYIRNRIREALAASDLGVAEGPDRVVTLVPFVADPRRAEMGAFADLTIRLRFDPAAPERILELSADTASGTDGYHERMVLIPEE